MKEFGTHETPAFPPETPVRSITQQGEPSRQRTPVPGSGIVFDVGVQTDGSGASKEFLGEAVDPSIVSAHLLSVADGPVRGDDPKHAGRHGTSLESVLHMLQTGVMPGRSTDLRLGYQQGDLNFFPTERSYGLALTMITPTSFLRFLHPKHREGYNSASYADQNAEEHFIIKALGFDIGDEGAARGAYSAAHSGDYDFSFFEAHGISAARVKKVVDHAIFRRGFVLGLSPRILEDDMLQILPGDYDIGDLFVRTGSRGLSYKDVTGIHPLGLVEEQFLNDLRTSENLQETLVFWESSPIIDTGEKVYTSEYEKRPSGLLVVRHIPDRDQTVSVAHSETPREGEAELVFGEKEKGVSGIQFDSGDGHTEPFEEVTTQNSYPLEGERDL